MDEMSVSAFTVCRPFQQDNIIAPDNVCRDFLRNVCTRGGRCKFKHSNIIDEAGRPNTSCRSGLVFCHDFQNTLCSRVNCKFVHGSRQEEDYYKVTGELPKYIQETPQLKLNSQEPSGEGEIPVCKDFLKRECQRGKKCKFLHVNEPRGTIKNRTEDFEIPEAKRRNLDEADGNYWSFTAQHLGLGANFTESTIASPVSFHPAVNKPVYAVHGNGSSYYDVNMLQEENMLLRKKVEDLKKQVTELMATNEFLLDQNAHYRIQGKYSSSATNLTTVSLPAVSIASSVSSCNLAVPVTSSITAFGALGPLSSVQTVQALATLPLVTAQSTSNISTSIPYATSVSLAQPAPLATVSLTPVTLNQTTPLASQNPALSAATATVTLTPTINGAAALQLQGTNSTLTFSGAEGSSLVSYPIMTQSLIASSGLPNSL